MTAAGVDGAIYPSTLCKVTVENVVEIGPEDDFLEELLDGQRVVHIEIAHRIAGQRPVFAFGVVKIHTADVARVPGGCPSFQVEVHESVQDG